MKEYMKAYHMFFAGRFVKYIIYLAEPLVTILLADCIWFVSQGGEGMPAAMITGIAAYIFFLIEIMADSLVFRGIGLTRNQNLEYLKTSVKWKSLLQKGLVFDTIRRLFGMVIVEVVLVFLVSSQIDAAARGLMSFLAAAVIVVGFFCTLVLWVVRCIENVYVIIAAIYAASTLLLVVLFLAVMFLTAAKAGIWLGIMLGAVLWMGAVAMQIRGIIKRVEGSFYDE